MKMLLMEIILTAGSVFFFKYLLVNANLSSL